MAVYALWNNKGGVGKSYLTFQIATEYARVHPLKKVLVVDLCPQANSSSMLLGGIENGELAIEQLSRSQPTKTISGYVSERIRSPYQNPYSGSGFITRVSDYNQNVDQNLFLICGDEDLELQAPLVRRACIPGPSDAWRIVHIWVRDLIDDVRKSWNQESITVFIDCNPSFTIFTELAMSAADRLLIPFSADGASKRAVRSVLSLLYGIQRRPGQPQSEYSRNTEQFRMTRPQIYSYIGNRLTQMNYSSASAFKQVVRQIFNEVHVVWKNQSHLFYCHPPSASVPTTKSSFKKMFEQQINDANTASVVSGALGIPICKLSAGYKEFSGRRIMVNQMQLDRQQPNIDSLVKDIE